MLIKRVIVLGVEKMGKFNPVKVESSAGVRKLIITNQQDYLFLTINSTYNEDFSRLDFHTLLLSQNEFDSYQQYRLIFHL